MQPDALRSAMIPLATSVARGPMAVLRALAVCLGLGTVSGCAALGALGEATTPLDTYELSPPAGGPVARGNPAAVDLVIERPSARGSIDTDRILIRPNRLQAQYLPGARWADTAPEMIQGLIVLALQDAGAARHVGRRPLGAQGDIALISELADFQAELAEDGRSAVIRVRLNAQLLRERSGNIASVRSFTGSARVDSTDTLSVVQGFEAATAEIVPDIMAWVMGVLGLRIDMPPAPPAPGG